MPTMANITVKDKANVDVVYVAQTPSAGDRVAAQWRVDAAHAIQAFRPIFSVTTRDNGKSNGRIIEGTFKGPVIQAVNGVDTLVATVPLSFSGTLPTNVSADTVLDMFYQFGNLVVSQLIRDSAGTGYAPT
jgi:hypothetical protein